MQGPPEGEIIKKSLHVLTTPLSLRDISPEGENIATPK